MLVSLGVIVLRKTMPEIERKFRCPGVPFTPAITILCCLVLLSRIHIKTWIGFIVWLTIGLIVYFTYGRKHSVLQNEDKSSHKSEPA
jgi:APA family basic amino acid/polyamine antiporter